MKITWDLGTYLLLIFLILLSIATIAFFFIKRNELFGLRVNTSLISEEVWHKVHVIAAISQIPLIIVYFLLMFSNSMLLKIAMWFVLFFVLVILWSLIPHLVTRKIVKAQIEKEKKELEEQVKKESGWIK